MLIAVMIFILFLMPVGTINNRCRKTLQSDREGEFIAILWGREEFHLYLYSSTFNLVTDHNALEIQKVVVMLSTVRFYDHIPFWRWKSGLLSFTRLNHSDLKSLEKLKTEIIETSAGLLLRGNRIVIPQTLQTQPVHLAHEVHQRIVKKEGLLLEKIWLEKVSSGRDTAC